MSDLELLAKRIKASAIQLLLMAGFFALAGIGMLALTVTQGMASGFGKVWFMGLMGVAALGGTWLLGRGALGLLPPQASKLYKAMESAPAPIGWAYLSVGKTNGIQIYELDGEQHTVYANGADSAALLALVRSRAPQAILGFGTEQEKRYRELVKAYRAARAPQG